MEEKNCTKCGNAFPLTEEHFSRILRRGKRVWNSRCKTCVAEYKKQHYLKDKDKYKARSSERRKRIPAEEMREYYREYREKNREELNRKTRERNAKDNYKKSRERWARYSKNNPLKEWSRNELTKAIQRGDIIRPDKCSECGKECVPDGHHEDYRKPLDVIWLCRTCHGKRHRKTSRLNEGRASM